MTDIEQNSKQEKVKKTLQFLSTQNADCSEYMENFVDGYYTLEERITELTKQLAERDAVIKKATEQKPCIYVMECSGRLHATPFPTEGYEPLYALPAIPEGMQLVPKEPTKTMMKEAQVAQMDHSTFKEWMFMEGDDVKRIWKAMLSAAPKGE